MISVSGVSMRFGSKILFEDVATTFSPGRRYGLTGPNGAGKSTFMKLAHRRHRAAARIGRPSAQARRPAPGSLRLRSCPRHRRRDHGQRAAVERPDRARHPVRASGDVGRGRHAPGRARRHCRRGRRLHRRKRCRDSAPGARHRRRAPRAADGRAAGRTEGARAAGAGALRTARRRCSSTSRRTTSTSTRFTGSSSSSSATTAR